MRFKLDTIYTDSCLWPSAAWPERLAQTLRDGRAAAFLVFEHLLGRFSDLKRNRDPDYPRDCIAKGDYVSPGPYGHGEWDRLEPAQAERHPA